MSRRRQTEKELRDLLLRLERIFGSTPLAIVKNVLASYITETVAAIEAGSARSGQDRNVVAFVSALIDLLPQSFNSRFKFDSAVIATIASEWSNDAVQLSSMIAPRYSNGWGHQTVTLPVNGKDGYPVDIVLTRGEDDLSSVDLLDYPWLAHELGHNLHFQSDIFARSFQERLSKRLTSLRSRTITSTGMGRSRSSARIDQFEEFWTPRPNHENWSYEVAVDIVALWTCGPAFLAAFQHVLSDQIPNPFYLSQSHPPYDLRVTALVDAAQRLSWTDYVADLERTKIQWRSSPAESGNRSNEYISLADNELVTSAVTCGLSACNDFGIPRLTSEHVDSLLRAIRRGDLPEYGVDLIVSAWIAEQEMSESEFQQWHLEVVSSLASNVTLECR